MKQQQIISHEEIDHHKIEYVITPQQQQPQRNSNSRHNYQQPTTTIEIVQMRFDKICEFLLIQQIKK